MIWTLFSHGSPYLCLRNLTVRISSDWQSKAGQSSLATLTCAPLDLVLILCLKLQLFWAGEGTGLDVLLVTTVLGTQAILRGLSLHGKVLLARRRKLWVQPGRMKQEAASAGS